MIVSWAASPEHEWTLVWLEQLYPFPAAALAEVLDRYPPGIPVVWVQEEPENIGGWP